MEGELTPPHTYLANSYQYTQTDNDELDDGGTPKKHKLRINQASSSTFRDNDHHDIIVLDTAFPTDGTRKID